MAEPDLRLTEIAKADISAVMDIDRESFGNARWRSEGSFLNGRQGDCFVVHDGKNDVVGYLILKKSDGGNAFVIIKMATHPNHRGKGVGRFILCWVKRFSIGEGATRLSLDVRQTNTSAYRLYVSKGFKEIQRIRNYYRHGADQDEKTAIKMELVL